MVGAQKYPSPGGEDKDCDGSDSEWDNSGCKDSIKSCPSVCVSVGNFLFRGRTHVRIKGQNLNFYLETHATPHNIGATPHDIYFIQLRILPRILGTLYWRVDDPCRKTFPVHDYKNTLLEDLCMGLC